jgi:hypothetical protein
MESRHERANKKNIWHNIQVTESYIIHVRNITVKIALVTDSMGDQSIPNTHLPEKYQHLLIQAWAHSILYSTSQLFLSVFSQNSLQI